jgi:SH3 domain-containing YSC84-like protein 1
MKTVPFIPILLSMLVAFGSTSARAAGMQDDVNQAATIMERFERLPETAIPKEVLRDAKGLAIMTATKAGFIVSGRGGSGVVIARRPSGWTGPSAIGTGGAGFGLQTGAEVTESVFVLNTDKAVDAFARGENVELGADLSVAAGPMGRTVEAGVMPVAAIYSCSHSQGLFAGASLEGTIIMNRGGANAMYYGRPVTPLLARNGTRKHLVFRLLLLILRSEMSFFKLGFSTERNRGLKSCCTRNACVRDCED